LAQPRTDEAERLARQQADGSECRVLRSALERVRRAELHQAPHDHPAGPRRSDTRRVPRSCAPEAAARAESKPRLPLESCTRPNHSPRCQRATESNSAPKACAAQSGAMTPAGVSNEQVDPSSRGWAAQVLPPDWVRTRRRSRCGMTSPRLVRVITHLSQESVRRPPNNPQPVPNRRSTVSKLHTRLGGFGRLHPCQVPRLSKGMQGR
jgi:hypothetical protein